MNDTAIIIPTRKRSHKLVSLLDNIAETAESPYKVYFVVDYDDNETIAYLSHLDRDDFSTIIDTDTTERTPQNYNLAYRNTKEPFIFIGADDIIFPQGWLRQAMEIIGSKGALAFAEKYADGWGHFLIRRSYIETFGVIDEPDKIFHEYHHEFADAEFQFTARMRRQIVYCNIQLIHMHPKLVGGFINPENPICPVLKMDYPWLEHYDIKTVEKTNDAVLVTLQPKNPIQWDETYLKNHNNINKDREEFLARSHLWGGQTEENLFRKDAVMPLS